MLRYGIPTAIIVAIIDQVTKIAALNYYIVNQSFLEVTPFFQIVLVQNFGISFGMFNQLDNSNVLFSVIAMLITIVLLLWLKQAENKMVALSLGAIIGGAIGNTIDRVRLGWVIDFLDFHIYEYHWPAFNIADAAIVVGVGFIFIDTIFEGGNKKQSID